MGSAVKLLPGSDSRAGIVCGALGIIGSVGCALLAVAGSVPEGGALSYPRPVPGHTTLQIVIALSNVGLIAGLLPLRWGEAASWRRRGRLAYVGTMAAVAALINTEGIAITVTAPSATPSVFGVIYVGYVALLGATLLMVGHEVARVRGPLRTWRRWLPLTLGAWLLIVAVPALAVGSQASTRVLAVACARRAVERFAELPGRLRSAAARQDQAERRVAGRICSRTAMFSARRKVVG
jgi:hypothetical protein